VEPAELSGHWQVSARNYVGSILVDGIQVLVRPKIPLQNLFLLLEVGLREQDWRDEAALYEKSLDLLPALVSFFARTAETTLARGLYHSYREQRDRLVALRGRVDVARQFTQPGGAIPVACRFTEFTADLLENSYLKAAVSRSLRVPGVQPADRHRLMRHLVALEDVADVTHRPSDFDDVTFTRLNEHYRPALRLARLVLENLTLQDAFGEVTASSFMLDMNELFERFVTERLRRALRGRLVGGASHKENVAAMTPPFPAAASTFSSVVVRHTGTVLHTYALDLSGTPAEVGKSVNDLADWIGRRAEPPGLVARPGVSAA